VVAAAEQAEGEIPAGSVVLGRYQVLGKLAQGGMAEVYLARQVGPGGYQKLVVTKRVRPHLSKDEDFVGMFVNEARLAAMINHPNVVQIFDLGEEQGISTEGSDWFLAMEYLDGRDMLQVGRACRSHNKAVPFDVTARIIADACAGLEHAHQLKGADGRSLDLVHRDMSPENIIITFEGQVKVVDFGIAKAADNSIRTQAGQIKGKLGYVAPEAILGKPVDARADIFAVGATLYLFLSGRPAFTGNSPMEIFERSLKTPPSPGEVNPRVPPVLDEICMKALAQDRDKRYRSAGEVRAALDAYLSSTGRPLGAPQLAQFMRILFPPDKDPVRQRIDKLLADAQSFSPASKRTPPGQPRTVSVPQMPGVAATQARGAPVPVASEQERTAVVPDAQQPSVPTPRASASQAPRAVDIGPLSAGGGASSPMTATMPAAQRPLPPPAAARSTGPSHLRSVGVSDEIPDVSNPRMTAPPIDDDGKTQLTGKMPDDGVRATDESYEVVKTMDVQMLSMTGDGKRVLDEPTLGGLDIEVSDDPDDEARAVAEALADDPSEVDGRAVEPTIPSQMRAESLPPSPPSDHGEMPTVQSPYARSMTQGRSPETAQASGTELPPPPFESSSPGAPSPELESSLPVPRGEEQPLFAEPAADLAREEIVAEEPARRRAPSYTDGTAAPVSLGLRLGMAALGVATGALIVVIGLAASGNLGAVTGH
jgi:serine/threonine-protein kinase